MTFCPQDVLTEEALVLNCCPHNINLEVQVPIQKALEGFAKGIESRCVMQLLFTVYLWEKEVGKDQLRVMWKSAVDYVEQFKDKRSEIREQSLVALLDDMMETPTNDGKKLNADHFIAMIKGCINRWWSVGVAADVLFKTLSLQLVMAKKFVQMTPRSSTAKSIAQDFISRAPPRLREACAKRARHSLLPVPQLRPP